MKYYIDESDLGVDYQDEGQWRSYGLEASGETLEELLNDAYVYETDQDGGEITSYPMSEAERPVYSAAKTLIEKTVK
jgi:hypothetical protein